MSWTFAACVLIAFVWIGLFYLWGKSFLFFIHAKIDVALSIAFGYLILQIVFQVLYLPLYLTRGSFRVVSYSWIIIVIILSILLIIYLRKHARQELKNSYNLTEKCGIVFAALLVVGLAIYISLKVPFYGQDTRTYITKMNESYYLDSLWNNTGNLSFHNGMCSMFEFFTISSLITGVKPYYISLFTVRIIGIGIFALVTYHIGDILFKKTNRALCWPALFLSVVVPYLLMFWGSNYTAEFFYWRIYEAKGYCQFVLLPIGFSVFLAMFKNDSNRKALWKEQLLVGMAAVPVSASSLTSYLFLLLMGTFALLAYDKLKKGWITIGHAIFCALPNLIYLVIYFLEKAGMIAL